MKLPLTDYFNTDIKRVLDENLYFVTEANTTCKALNDVRMHNEQIAAQLTMIHCSSYKNSKEDIDATYKEYLGKLNSGDL